MNSNDLGDTDLWSGRHGWAGVIVALICFGIAASYQRTEEEVCTDRCAPKVGQIIQVNDQMDCRCLWEDGTLHVPVPSPTEMIAP